jgi:hypothetical protein
MEDGGGVGVLASATRNVPGGAFVKGLEIMKAFSSYSDPSSASVMPISTALSSTSHISALPTTVSPVLRLNLHQKSARCLPLLCRSRLSLSRLSRCGPFSQLRLPSTRTSGATTMTMGWAAKFQAILLCPPELI